MLLAGGVKKQINPGRELFIPDPQNYGNRHPGKWVQQNGAVAMLKLLPAKPQPFGQKALLILAKFFSKFIERQNMGAFLEYFTTAEAGWTDHPS